MKNLVFCLLIFCAPCWIFSQVQYDVEPRVEATVEKHIEAWDRVGKINIFCIQVASLSGEGSGANAQAMVAELNQYFAANGIDAQAYTIFVQPNHKVRVGNFLSKREAYKVMSVLQIQYPGAFITRDKRKISEWVKN